VIRSIRHKALRRFFTEGISRGFSTDQVARLRFILSALHAADRLEEIATVPGWRLHRLKGDLKDYWSLSVTGNWRLVFRWHEGAAEDVDLVDYH
jgi:proteic killer suppression protein